VHAECLHTHTSGEIILPPLAPINDRNARYARGDEVKDLEALTTVDVIVSRTAVGLEAPSWRATICLAHEQGHTKGTRREHEGCLRCVGRGRVGQCGASRSCGS
jgi:hypothetical protein